MYSMCNQDLSAVASVTTYFRGTPPVLHMKQSGFDVCVCVGGYHHTLIKIF